LASVISTIRCIAINYIILVKGDEVVPDGLLIYSAQPFDFSGRELAVVLSEKSSNDFGLRMTPENPSEWSILGIGFVPCTSFPAVSHAPAPA
jgi:hypothetical protein